MIDARPTNRQILRELIRHPIRYFILEWNWKSALLSALGRASIFLTVNLSVGLAAGLRAGATELLFRGVASGVFGSLTQHLSRARHPWMALVLLPLLGHTAEFAVHSLAGTPKLAASIAASVAFSVLTTAFNLFAMSRGALRVGSGEQSFGSDLRRLPGLLRAFAGVGVRAPWQIARAWKKRRRRSKDRVNRRPRRQAAVQPL